VDAEELPAAEPEPEEPAHSESRINDRRRHEREHGE
jgi:hypothetical protein